VIFASGLKYVGVEAGALGWVLCGVLLAAVSLWMARARPWRRAENVLELASARGGGELEQEVLGVVSSRSQLP
jgi:hypothetical protein